MNDFSFGRALKSIRASRGLTGAQTAELCDLNASHIALVERSRRPIDTFAVHSIVAGLGLDADDRRRLAGGWSDSGVWGDAVRYEVRPLTEAGHTASALLAVFAEDLDDETWEVISALVSKRIPKLGGRIAA